MSPRVVLCQVPPSFLPKGDSSEKVSDGYTERLVLGPEESVEYDFLEVGYVYGAPLVDDLEKCPKDKDGFFIRKRSKVLGRMPL